MIALKNISCTFNLGQATELKALQDISCEITEQEFVVIVGANGSGKSTLLNVIAGAIQPDSGSVSLMGNDVTAKKEYERARYISRVFQNPLSGTSPELSIIENFRLAALRTHNKGLKIGLTKTFEEKVRDKISFLRMGLENNIYKPMGSLSGGQRQALTLVMGIMDECNIMLLDEPVAALDPRSAKLVMEKADEIIKENKLTAIMVTHHLKDALNFGNRLIMMEEGHIKKDISHSDKKKITSEEIQSWFD